MPSVGLWFDRAGAPIADPVEVVRLLHDRVYRFVARTKVADAAETYVVYTVWMGLVHSCGDSPPLIFETGVYPVGEPGDEAWRRQWATEAQARAGHAQAVVEFAATFQDAVIMDVDPRDET